MYFPKQELCDVLLALDIWKPYLLTILVLKLEKKSILLPVDVSKIMLDEWQMVKVLSDATFWSGSTLFAQAYLF